MIRDLYWYLWNQHLQRYHVTNSHSCAEGIRALLCCFMCSGRVITHHENNTAVLMTKRKIYLWILKCCLNRFSSPSTQAKLSLIAKWHLSKRIITLTQVMVGYFVHHRRLCRTINGRVVTEEQGLFQLNRNCDRCIWPQESWTRNTISDQGRRWLTLHAKLNFSHIHRICWTSHIHLHTMSKKGWHHQKMLKMWWWTPWFPVVHASLCGVAFDEWCHRGENLPTSELNLGWDFLPAQLFFMTLSLQIYGFLFCRFVSSSHYIIIF